MGRSFKTIKVEFKNANGSWGIMFCETKQSLQKEIAALVDHTDIIDVRVIR